MAPLMVEQPPAVVVVSLQLSLAKPQHQKERSLLVQGISQTFRPASSNFSVVASSSPAWLTRSTQQENHHRDPQRRGGWGGRSEIFTCGVGEGREAPLRLRPGIWGARVGGSPQEQAPRVGPKAAGRLGKHQPTQPVAEGVGVGIRRLKL